MKQTLMLINLHYRIKIQIFIKKIILIRIIIQMVIHILIIQI
jgi:hypothetical protein